MKKTNLLKSMLLLCALIVGSGSSWATEVTISVGSSSLTWTADGNDYKATSDGFNLRYEKGSYANAISGGIQSEELRLYSGTNFVISSTNTITKIVYNVADGTGKNYSVSALSTEDGNLTDGTWTGSATSVSASLSAQNRIKSVTITYSSAYTITAQSSNNSYGTVALSGTTITATPAAGYRVANGDDGYTVTSGTATVTHTGHSNTLTVSASTDCTVRVNFEAIPTHTLSSVVSPAAAGTVTLGSTTVAESATTTATAAAAAGYKFTGWDISGTGATLSSTTDNPTTVTMGTADATVTATFEAVTTYAITFSVNGNNTIVNVEKDAAVDLSAPASGIPAGYTFIGWRTSALASTDTDPNDYVTSATSTANITYYAVFAVQTASLPDTYEKLTSNSFVAGATYLIGGKQSADVETIWYLKSYANVDSNSDWGVATTNGSDAITFTLSGTASALVAQDNSGNYLEGLSTGKFKMSSTQKTVYLDESGNIKASSEGYYLRHNYNSGSGGFRWYSSSNAMNGFFYRVIKNSTYANYCTSLPVSVSITPAKTYTTLTSANPLDFTSVSSNLKAYIATEISGGSVQMMQVDKVPANTGLVLKATTPGDAIDVPVLSGAADDVSANKMAGSAFSTTAIAANGGYILSNGVFQPASAGTLAAGKAYLNIAFSSAHPLEMSFDDGEVTSIEHLDATTTQADGQYYNLAGQRVANPTKGLYIVNGKKVIIK